MIRYLSYSEFRNNIHKSISPPIRKDYEFKVAPSIDENSRIVTFTASTGSVDRMGDTINQDGWKLDNFLKNPVILFGHNSSAPPIGHASKVYFVNGNLTLDVDFVPKEICEFADKIFQMLKRGDLRACSVGMQPLKWSWVETQDRFGIDFIEQELLELSVVTIPANAEALVKPKQVQMVPGSPAHQLNSGSSAKMSNRLKILKLK